MEMTKSEKLIKLCIRKGWLTPALFELYSKIETDKEKDDFLRVLVLRKKGKKKYLGSRSSSILTKRR